LPAGEGLVDPHVVKADAPFEHQREDQDGDRLEHVLWIPALHFAHAQESVADIAIAPEHVRERVVLAVV
jgi:hypothetical protein